MDIDETVIITFSKQNKEQMAPSGTHNKKVNEKQ